MKSRLGKDEILDRIMENAPDRFAKRRAVLLRKALGRNLIHSAIEAAVKARRGVRHSKVKGANPNCENWDAGRLCDELGLLFHQIGTEIASDRPSPWQDVPDVILTSLKTYVKKCIHLRKGGNQKYWREDAVLEIAPVEADVAKVKGITREAVRLEAQLDIFPEGQKLDSRTADKYAKRKVAAAVKMDRKRIHRTKQG